MLLRDKVAVVWGATGRTLAECLAEFGSATL